VIEPRIGPQLGVDSARGQPLRDRRWVQQLGDREDADQLVGVLARLDADDRDDVDLVRLDDDMRSRE
jgi:hypothetical protein